MLAHSYASPCPQVEADKFQQLPDNLCSEKARTDPHPTDKIIEQDELSFKEVTWTAKGSYHQFTTDWLKQF